MSDQTDAASRPATATAPGPVPDDGKLDPALLRLCGTVMLGAIMVILDTTIVSVAIRDLGKEFDTSLSTISWVTTGYLLALAVVIPLSGWAVERFGATRMWNISLTMFIVGSALCGLAWSAPVLVGFRVLQGLGGGMIMPICMTLLARSAGPTRINRVMSIIGVPTLIAPVLGPVIGGLIVDNLSWRWIFYVNLPIGALALFLSWRVLPRDDRGSSSNRLDLAGLALISPGLAGVVYGLSEAGNGGGFGSLKVELSIIIGLVLLVGFVLHALRAQHPLLDMKLFSNKDFSLASVATFVIGAVLFGALFLLPLYYQVDRGLSASTAGLLLAPQGLGAMIAMSFSGRIADRRGPGSVVPVGMALTLIGTIPFTMVGGHTNELLLAAVLFVRGLGFGAAMMPAMAAAYQTLAPSAVPRATTTLNILQRVGGSVATALVAVELQHNIASRLPGVGGGKSTLAVAGAKLPGPVADKVASAFGATFWWVIGLSAVGFVASLFLPRISPPAAVPTPVTPSTPAREPVAVD
ncbi:DHA2 family efflux MFS transporter permease subunit [Frankia sp. AgB1.9]|uniref:DHA2 family efflux MFS transporter permease subunit n=1 Tax=unclassified Frankia TaxID=2632575 RepID=UPI001932569F|nr:MULTISPECIES: DHA2 family efflux MFS transporter permease subunit [unclassified Frankia]MBL7491082.1 DHA2 family efflux MFS transporter permease subunit [Frankia sp. AgW1.1]MBL7548789.1 DHA2 family efflux MFS transporter permease subunit [Frankia sp. AgB1.9]MBL7623878.1 DHA2 family efflux MFS transporter permease subunit [Frankia sp. AgB1.8]